MRLRLSIILFFIILFFIPCTAWGKPFILVIDPGHGGKDPGAIGAIAKEKDINLQVALKLGSLIEKNHEDVQIIYTRKTDCFIELDERANKANKAKADLFISIHANAIKSPGFAGTETYTLGLARTDENLAVAKRENSAILLEDDYKQTYEGFDPNSTESYIIFEFMQNKYVEQSVSLASFVQKEFTSSAKRTDRGVKQAGFLVLRKTSMPSILIELGFMTNREEEKFMKSDAGQKALSESIYKAFSNYKKEHDRKLGALTVDAETAPKKANTKASPVEQPVDNTPAATAKGADEPQQTNEQVYKVQILTSSKKLSANSSKFKGYKVTDYYKDKSSYKYLYGESKDFNEIKKVLNKISKDFKDAFIVEFEDGVRIK